MPKKQVDLSAEASKSAPKETKATKMAITRETLKEICPKEFRPLLTKAKTLGALVDLLKIVEERKKELSKVIDPIAEFESKIKMFFVQELPNQKGAGATGIAGTKYRVQLKDRVSYSLSTVDSDKFYAYVKKNNAWDLMTRAVSAPAIEQRLSAGKTVPGIEKFTFKSLSVTKI